MNNVSQSKEIDDLRAELKARGEILDAIQKATGEGWWLGCADWRQKLRDFAEDAEIIWAEADDERPMFHVQIKSDPPHRTCIHRLHLADWLDHLAELRHPVRVMLIDDLEK